MKVKKMTRLLRFVLGEHNIGITLAPFGVYIREDYLDDVVTISHEKIHWKQQMEMLIIFFYIWYGIEWFCKIGVHGKMAYYALSFEREAYLNESNLNYLSIRKKYNWLKYVVNGK